MTIREFLKMVGNKGAYGSEIDDGDEATEALTRCVELGLVKCEQSRVDDFFYLTPAGRAELRRR